MADYSEEITSKNLNDDDIKSSNEFIWACENVIEVCRRVERPICKLTAKPCIAICGNGSLYRPYWLLKEYENCPAYKPNPLFFVSNKEREAKGLLYYIG